MACAGPLPRLAGFRPGSDRASTGVWFIINSSTFTVRHVQWGVPGDVRVPGDYDRDGKTDIAVYRPSTGVSFITRSSTSTVQRATTRSTRAQGRALLGSFQRASRVKLAVGAAGFPLITQQVRVAPARPPCLKYRTACPT